MCSIHSKGFKQKINLFEYVTSLSSWAATVLSSSASWLLRNSCKILNSIIIKYILNQCHFVTKTKKKMKWICDMDIVISVYKFKNLKLKWPVAWKKTQMFCWACVTSELFHCSYNRDSFYVIFLWYVCLAYGPCAWIKVQIKIKFKNESTK